jgi:putative transposase
MAGRRRFVVPAGWVARGFRFEVEASDPEQRSRIAQQFGGRRFAHNWALAQVKANLDARESDPGVSPLAWDAYRLRKQWNQAKHQVAPWWRACSKEAYASGIADLVQGLHNWSDAKHGRRAGRQVGFPKFKARHRDRGRVRFTTGAMRLEPDRRHLVLPVVGRLRCKENTRRLQRLVVKGRARILSMTLSEQGRHGADWWCRCRQSSASRPPPPASQTPAVGSIWGSGGSGRSSPTATTLSRPSPILPHGLPCTSSVAGSPGSAPAGSSAPEPTARRTPSWRRLTGERRTSALTISTPSRPSSPAATAPSWSRISTSPRWPAGWAVGCFDAASRRLASVGFGRC